MIIAYDYESSPVEWMFVFTALQHLQRCGSQRFCFGHQRLCDFQVAMKIQHQLRSTQGINLPLAHYGCRASGDEESPRQTDHSFTRANFTASRIAGKADMNFRMFEQTSVNEFRVELRHLEQGLHTTEGHQVIDVDTDVCG